MQKTQLVAVIFLGSLNAHPTFAGFIRPIIFPVDGAHSFIDDLADARSGGREHEGVDIMAAKMTPIVSATDGRVRFITIPEASWGYGIFIEDADGYRYHYLHINNDTPGTDDGNGGERYAFAPGIERDARVTKGQHIAWVGDSGNAEWVGSHLHFEIHDPQGTAINPYESLLAASPPSAVSPSGEIIRTVIIIPRGGELIKYASDPKVYLLSNGTKRHIADAATFNALGFSWSSIRTIPETEQYRTGVPIQVTNGVVAQYEDGTPVVANTGTGIGTGPGTVSSSYTFTLTLSLGDSGTEVIELQRILQRLGYFTYPTITGYFGTATRDAVLRFQAAYTIELVGIVGPKTRAALNAL